MKKAKYIALGAVAIIFLLACVITLGIYMWVSSTPYCSEEKKATANSPDGKYTAIVFQRECGVGVESYAHVNLFNGSEKVRPGLISGRIREGTVFTADWYPKQLKVQWAGPRTLVIDCSDCTRNSNSPQVAPEKRSSWQDVSIYYNLRDDAH
jgi:hypothetical protein